MGIKQLKYFCEVVDVGDKNVASKNLFVAPTPIKFTDCSVSGVVVNQNTRR